MAGELEASDPGTKRVLRQEESAGGVAVNLTAAQVACLSAIQAVGEPARTCQGRPLVALGQNRLKIGMGGATT